MEQYNPNAICPKCHFIGIATEWMDEETNQWIVNRAVVSRIYPLPELRVVSPEHIRRTCFNCKHAWQESPLDAKEAQ